MTIGSGTWLVLLIALSTSVARAQSGLAAVPQTAVLAPGQQLPVTIAGATGMLTATTSGPAAAASVDGAGGRTLRVTAFAVGSAIVHVADTTGASLDIPITVLPAAGRIPDRIALAVTGDPVSPDFLAARIDAAIGAAVAPSLTPGSRQRTGSALPGLAPLGAGFLTGYRVPVAIDAGPGAAPVGGGVNVDVENLALPPLDPVALAFADDPERITADGVLSRTTVDAARPARIYYYHENTGRRRRFCVVLSVNDSVRSRVQIVGAAAGPSSDVMTVGHAVTKTFLAREPRGEGVVLTIAGGRPILERDIVAGPGDGIVGLLDLRVLDGGPLTATVMAIPEAADPAAYLYAPKLPDDGHSRHGTFDLRGYARDVIAYSAGGRDVAYVYGNRKRTLPNADPADPGRDYGDYGVLQRVTFDLDNPTAAPARLYLYEKPLGGDVRSSFLVNDELVEVGCVRVSQPYLVSSVDLPAHATGAFDVLTLTDGGSNYPLEIGVTTRPPLPAAPAISAADGCFPKPGGPAAAPQPAGALPGL